MSRLAKVKNVLCAARAPSADAALPLQYLSAVQHTCVFLTSISHPQPYCTCSCKLSGAVLSWNIPAI